MNKSFYIFLLFFTCFCCETKSQTNLVYNGDFEIYDTCPNNLSQPYLSQVKYCSGWKTPTAATSDYFNACDNPTFFHLVGIPSNFCGFQFAHSGNAYCGLYCNAPDTIWREYIMGILNQTIVKNKRYKLSFYLSLAEISGVASSKIGAYLSSNSINMPTYSYALNVQPQIINQSGNFLTDTLNWVKIEGEFVANGDEKYITIGWFGNDAVTDTLTSGITTGNPQESYYYIDDVELYESECVVNLPNVFTPNKDGANDVLVITTCDDVKRTTIYNRWGNKVFETTDVNHYWDGRTTTGEECIDGNYFYIIETEEKSIKGYIQLVR